jgi:hypothetical protein
MVEKKSKRRRHRKAPDPLEKLRRRIDQGPYKDFELRPISGDSEKMSTVLGRFIDPFIDHTDSEESYRKLVSLAVMAWNAALLTNDEGRNFIDQVIEKGLSGEETALKTDLRSIIDQLVERKRKYFSHYRRQIVEFEVVDLGDQYHLMVASTPYDVDPNQT